MIKKLTLISLACAITAFNLTVLAESEPQYRSGGDMTPEERIASVQYITNYRQCLQKESVARLSADSDVRTVMDQSMKACSNYLDELTSKLTSQGIDPEFAGNFASAMGNRAVRKLMPDLMAAQASR